VQKDRPNWSACISEIGKGGNAQTMSRDADYALYPQHGYDAGPATQDLQWPTTRSKERVSPARTSHHEADVAVAAVANCGF